MKKVIEIKNISKIYDLGVVGTGTLSKDLNRLWARLRKKPDPYSTIIEKNDRTKKSNSNIVFALKNINFSAFEGDVIGIIGKNGAGKSTLLKILSEITSPTSGHIKIEGKIASLLEVGTGMHPEMTARQNIFLNGSFMGMSRLEIKSKIKDIIEFAGIQKYIDTPIKRFSTGMQVRLGFAIAAFLEPDILIIDEVLAVGDAEFQKKAVGKIKDISNENKRTILFVSHNMTAVKSLCSKGIVIENGEVKKSGTIDECLDYYSNENIVVKSSHIYEKNNRPGSEFVELIKYDLINNKGEIVDSFNCYEDCFIEIEFEILKESKSNIHYLNIHLFDSFDNTLMICSCDYEDAVSKLGLYSATIKIPKNTLNVGNFKIGIAVTSYPGTNVHFFEKNAIIFEVKEEVYSNRKNPYIGFIPGNFLNQFKLNIKKTK